VERSPKTPATPRTEAPPRRWLWFFAIWAASVTVFAVLVALLKLVMGL
jgi:hypothetical protein